MRSENWAHLAIGLEVAAFFLVTPQFLGEKVMKQISSRLTAIAETIVAPLCLFVWSELREFLASFNNLFTDIRQYWKKPRILVLTLSGPLLTIAALGLFVSRHYWLGGVVAGVIVLGPLFLSMAVNFFFMHKILAKTARAFRLDSLTGEKNISVSVRIGLPLPVVLGPLLAVFLSISLWDYLLPAYLLQKVSEIERLRNYLFVAGVLAFLVSKAIEYTLVH